MSKLKLESNSSGAGNVTLKSPNTDSDRTLTLPDDNGTIVHQNASGYVGIGTSSPARDLHISTTNPHIRMTDTDASDSYSEIFGGSGVLEFDADTNNVVASSLIKFNVDGDTKVTINSSGNVGIGTSPSVNLEINKASARMKLSDGTNQVNFGLWDGSNYRLEGDANRPILITSYDTDGGVRIGDSGSTDLIVIGSKVGIGTTSPAKTLHVKGQALFDEPDNGYSGLRIHNDTSSDYNTYLDMGRNQSGTRLHIRRSGRVQGTTPWTDDTPVTIVSFAKGGIAFGSDTADANTLDDYEEGTWSPQLTDGSTTTSGGTIIGTYTKIGRLVHARFSFINMTTNRSLSGNWRISNLPFATGTSGGGQYGEYYGGFVTYNRYINVGGDWLSLWASNASNFYHVNRNYMNGTESSRVSGTVPESMLFSGELIYETSS